jgi:GT2 family glycosyltransferase
MHRVAAIITNYNMPERADSLAQTIKCLSGWPVDVYLVDNGSDLMEPAQHTNVFLRHNVQTTQGWLSGLQEADLSKEDYFAYWFLITSAEFVNETSVLRPMVEWLIDNPRAVGIHPALSEDSTTNWKHLINRGFGLPRQTWMIDNIASLYRADWFTAIGRFDPDMIYGWGIDLETSYKARKQGRSLWVDERVEMRKITDIGYEMNRMNMTSQERRILAAHNMTSVLQQKYGRNWKKRMTDENVDTAWR